MSTSGFDTGHEYNGICIRRHNDYNCDIPPQWYEHCNPPRKIYGDVDVRLRLVRIETLEIIDYGIVRSREDIPVYYCLSYVYSEYAMMDVLGNHLQCAQTLLCRKYN